MYIFIKILINYAIFPECHKIFALVVRGAQELKEKLFSFIITDEEVNKTNYLQTLCRQMALAIRVADAVSYILRYLPVYNSLNNQVYRKQTSQMFTVNFVGRKAINLIQNLPYVMLLAECWQKYSKVYHFAFDKSYSVSIISVIASCLGSASRT